MTALPSSQQVAEVRAAITLRMALAQELRTRIDEFAQAAVDHGASPPSALRLLDAATWMTYSRSGQAKAVRQSLGVR